jgi:TIR domain
VKVFISWSGDQSQMVALALRDWLPSVIQAIEPYVSSEDIDKGARWNTDIARELEDSSFGILCITPENIEAPWVNFEAGALSKSLDRSRVAPFLFGVQRSDVQGPLLQFQSTVYKKADVKKLVKSINEACGELALPEGRLEEVFEVWWNRLKEKLDEVETVKAPPRAPSRTQDDILAEVLELVRGQEKTLADPTQLFPPDYVELIMGNARRHPDISNAALQDLDQGWSRVLRLLADHTGTEDVPLDVTEALYALDPPIQHIIRRLHRRGTRRARPDGN